jgi:hypothetical protein
MRLRCQRYEGCSNSAHGLSYNRLERAVDEAFQKGDVEAYDRLRAEQEKLGRFRPWMTYSCFEEAPSVVIHMQMLSDYVTVDEFGRTMLDELNRDAR